MCLIVEFPLCISSKLCAHVHKAVQGLHTESADFNLFESILANSIHVHACTVLANTTSHIHM